MANITATNPERSFAEWLVDLSHSKKVFSLKERPHWDQIGLLVKLCLKDYTGWNRRGDRVYHVIPPYLSRTLQCFKVVISKNFVSEPQLVDLPSYMRRSVM